MTVEVYLGGDPHGYAPVLAWLLIYSLYFSSRLGF